MNGDETIKIQLLMLQNNSNALQQVMVLRYQALTIISSISIALLILVDFENKSINLILLKHSFAIFLFVTIIGLGRYIYLTRADIIKISEKIKNISKMDVTKPPKDITTKSDYLVEFLYILFTIGLILFSLSMLKIF